MARQCMRPGCDRPVAASLTYDTESVAVWLDRPEDGGEMAQQVCAVHAANLTVPLGWTVTDRRLAPVPSAGPLPPEAVPPAEDQGADDEAGPADSPADTGVPENEAPRPVQRKPKGLLDRAFEWTGPQHSVLTTGSRRGRTTATPAIPEVGPVTSARATRGPRVAPWQSSSSSRCSPRPRRTRRGGS